MTIGYRPFTRADAGSLAGFLAEEPWPFHTGKNPGPDEVLGRVDDGHYDSESVRTFWILEGGHPVGLVRLEDLDDDTPMFDLRLREVARGRGLGTGAVLWLTDYLFTELAHVRRIEATTRQDNVAMRRALLRGGYVREAHYRQGWPTPGGLAEDAVGYAILRTDWASHTVTPVPWDGVIDGEAPGPTVLRIRDGALSGCGSWLYVWITSSNGRVIYVGGTGLPPQVRTWLHLHDPDPGVGRVAARYPGAASEEIDVLVRRLPDGVPRAVAKAGLVRRLGDALLLAEDYVGERSAVEDAPFVDSALSALLDGLVARVAAHQRR